VTIDHICLLLGRDHLRGWLVDALSQAESETGATVDLIVRTDTHGREPATPMDHPFDADVIYSHPETVAGGRRVRPREGTVNRIAAETDVVVQNGVGVLTGRILTAPEYGVLSYHHGDIRRYRGVITHFWNYLNRDDEGGVTLLQLDESLDGGGIAAERAVDLSACVTWGEVERRKQRAGVPLVTDAIENFADPTFEPTELPEKDLGRMYYSSDVTLPVVANYLVLETAKAGISRVQKLRYLLGLYRS
jgi:folate-dependent phosphoribosylglycinamide formyltransferase PurN